MSRAQWEPRGARPSRRPVKVPSSSELCSQIKDRDKSPTGKTYKSRHSPGDRGTGCLRVAGETRGSVYDGRHNSPGDRRPGLSSTFVFTEEARGCKMTCPGEHSHTRIRRDKSSPRGEEAPGKAASQTQPRAAARPAPKLPKTDPQGASRASRTRREGIWSLRIGQTATMWASNWNLGVSLSSKH